MIIEVGKLYVTENGRTVRASSNSKGAMFSGTLIKQGSSPIRKYPIGEERSDWLVDAFKLSEKSSFKCFLKASKKMGYKKGVFARWNYLNGEKREGIIKKFYWASGRDCLLAEIKLKNGNIDYIPILLDNVWAEIVPQEQVYEIGFWYKSNKGNLVFFKSFERETCYGFSYGTNNTEWRDGMTFNIHNCTWIKATTDEVKMALENEAIKRGFGKIGVHFFDYGEIETSNIKGFKFWNIHSENINVNKFNISVNTNKGVIYRQGEWSKIVPEIILKDAEVKLGAKIV